MGIDGDVPGAAPRFISPSGGPSFKGPTRTGGGEEPGSSLQRFLGPGQERAGSIGPQLGRHPCSCRGWFCRGGEPPAHWRPRVKNSGKWGTVCMFALSWLCGSGPIISQWVLVLNQVGRTTSFWAAFCWLLENGNFWGRFWGPFVSTADLGMKMPVRIGRGRSCKEETLCDRGLILLPSPQKAAAAIRTLGTCTRRDSGPHLPKGFVHCHCHSMCVCLETRPG